MKLSVFFAAQDLEASVLGLEVHRSRCGHLSLFAHPSIDVYASKELSSGIDSACLGQSIVAFARFTRQCRGKDFASPPIPPSL